MSASLQIASLQGKVSDAEWQLRCDLAAAYRLVDEFGWSDLVFTHISARMPGPEHHFLINPYGLAFDEITASSLVKVDAACNKLHDSPFPVNPAGFVIHSAVHEVRDDAGCVLHTHTRSQAVAGLAAVQQQRAARARPGRLAGGHCADGRHHGAAAARGAGQGRLQGVFCA